MAAYQPTWLTTGPASAPDDYSRQPFALLKATAAPLPPLPPFIGLVPGRCFPYTSAVRVRWCLCRKTCRSQLAFHWQTTLWLLLWNCCRGGEEWYDMPILLNFLAGSALNCHPLTEGGRRRKRRRRHRMTGQMQRKFHFQVLGSSINEPPVALNLPPSSWFVPCQSFQWFYFKVALLPILRKLPGKTLIYFQLLLTRNTLNQIEVGRDAIVQSSYHVIYLNTSITWSSDRIIRRWCVIRVVIRL